MLLAPRGPPSGSIGPLVPSGPASAERVNWCLWGFTDLSPWESCRLRRQSVGSCPAMASQASRLRPRAGAGGGVHTAASSEFMSVSCLDALVLFFLKRESASSEENGGKVRLAGVSALWWLWRAGARALVCECAPARVCLPQVTVRSGRCRGSELQGGLCHRPCGRPSGWPRRLQVVMLALCSLSWAGQLTLL